MPGREISIDSLGGDKEVLAMLHPGGSYFLEQAIIGICYLRTPVFDQVYPDGWPQDKFLLHSARSLGRALADQTLLLKFGESSLLSAAGVKGLPDGTRQFFQKAEAIKIEDCVAGIEAAEQREADYMAKQDRWITVRQLLAVDRGLIAKQPQTRAYSSYINTAVRDRSTLRQLAEQGILDSQTMTQLAELTRELTGEVYYWGRNTEWTAAGRLPLLYIWSNGLRDDSRLASDGWSVETAYMARIEGNHRYHKDKDSLAVDVDKSLQILARQAAVWLTASGWKNPENWLEPGLEMLRRLHNLVGTHQEDNWRAKDDQTREIASSLINETVIGQILRQTERLYLYAGAEREFFRRVQAEGLAVCQKTRLAEPDRGITIKAGQPEHLLIDLLATRQKRHRGIIGGVVTVKSEKPFYESDKRPFAGKMAGDIFREANLGEWQAEVERRGIGNGFNLIKITTEEELGRVIEELLENAKAIGEQQVKLTVLPEDLQHLAGTYAQVLKLFRDMHQRPNSYTFRSGGFYGDYWERLIKEMEAVAKDGEAIVSNDVRLIPGRPLVLLGGNGQGKSCLEAMVLNGLMAPVLVAAEEMKAPADIFLETMADLTEIEGAAGLHSARGQGKSGFMVEIERFISQFTVITRRKVSLKAWDEFWRKTDQLNGMALMMLAEVLVNISGAYSIQASHINPINRIAGPLLERLGIEVDWATMENFKLQAIDAKTVVQSRAWQNCRQFLPEMIGGVWAGIHGAVRDDYSFGEKHKRRDKRTYTQERLMQMGWIIKLCNQQQWMFSPAAEWLLGHDYSQEKTERINKLGGIFPQLISETLFNYDWEQERMPRWINSLDTNRERAEAAVEQLDPLVNLWLRLDELYKYRDSSPEWLKRVRLLEEELGKLKKERRAEILEAVKTGGEVLNGFFTADEREEFEAVFNDEDYPVRKLVEQIKPVVEKIVIWENLRALTEVMRKNNFCPVEQNGGVGMSFTGLWGVGLADNLRSQGRRGLVTNDLFLDRSMLITGPHGSGKSEAGLALAEAMFLGTRFGRAPASRAIINGKWQMMVMMTPLDKQPNEAEVSSGQREARDRLGAISDWLESLPEEVRPLVIVDELGSATNTTDAAEMIRTVVELVEDKFGGITVCSTHCHEAVGDLERAGRQMIIKHAGLFDTEQQYQLLDGPGDSLGIEVARKLGMLEEAAALAELFRNYILAATAAGAERDQVIEQFLPESRVKIAALRRKLGC